MLNIENSQDTEKLKTKGKICYSVLFLSVRLFSSFLVPVFHIPTDFSVIKLVRIVRKTAVTMCRGLSAWIWWHFWGWLPMGLFPILIQGSQLNGPDSVSGEVTFSHVTGWAIFGGSRAARVTQYVTELGLWTPWSGVFPLFHLLSVF